VLKTPISSNGFVVSIMLGPCAIRNLVASVDELAELVGADEYERLRRDSVRNKALREMVEATHAAYVIAVHARHERVRELAADGWSPRRIARHLGLSRAACQKVLR
jgi:hypothetical protein